MRYRLTILVGVIALLLLGRDASAQSVRDVCVADTIYHAVISTQNSTLTIHYGPYRLVSCIWSTNAKNSHLSELADTGHTAPEPGIVVGRTVWQWEQAIPARLTRVVAGATSATPEQVARIIPHRFEIALSNDLTLCIRTPAGDAAPHVFAEKWRRWLGAFCHDLISGRVEMIVSPGDAQTLYYALEKGTPVFVE